MPIHSKSSLLGGQLRASLVHGDFQPSNIFVEGAVVTGVIDCEWAHAGCGEAEWFVARQRLLDGIDDPRRRTICASEFDAQCTIPDLEQYHERCKVYEADDCLNSNRGVSMACTGMDADGVRQLDDRIRARAIAFEHEWSDHAHEGEEDFGGCVIHRQQATKIER
jgi:aminoglycoside phosphotransferase (APT) family kinase protein